MALGVELTAPPPAQPAEPRGSGVDQRTDPAEIVEVDDEHEPDTGADEFRRAYRSWLMMVTTKEVRPMTKVAAGITTSLDGYITGPNDGPGRGLGDGGERLHYWVFGGPWSYEAETSGEAAGADKEYLDGGMARAGAVVIGRGMYEAAEAWGGQNPFGVPLFVVTHRPEDAPSGGGFTFVD